jgi:ABC-type sugar transport system ATPase subunit
VDIRLFPGEVHGLCGENGSGKSTLLKILSGQVTRDEGTVSLADSSVEFKNPGEALRAGIATVTQERTLVPQLTVAENVLLGHGKSRKPWGIDWRSTRQRAREVLDRVDCPATVDALVSDLPPGQAQLVEIARSLTTDMKVLVLDEPTSSLSTHEVEALFKAVRGLREQGVAIVFISHRMPEVFEICDRLTILRDGHLVSSGVISEFSPDRVVADMLGRELSAFQSLSHAAGESEPILEIRALGVERRCQEVSLTLGKGEILGIAGLVGAGHSEVVETLFGIHPDYDGEVLVHGTPVRIKDPRRAMRQRVAFVPGDRKVNGLVLDMSVLENAVMASTSLAGRLRQPRPPKAVRFVKQCVEQFGIVTESLSTPVVRLSGGNQQKVLLSKWVGTEPEILVLDEPTRGVDVGAKAEIYRILLAQRDAGMSILISSSEVPELLTLCDRIVVMHRGRVAGTLLADEADEETVLRYAMGQAS